MSTYSTEIAFLGYYTYPTTTIDKRLLLLRRANGWTLDHAARAMGCDGEAWRRWEKGQPIRYSVYRTLISDLLGQSRSEV